MQAAKHIPERMCVVCRNHKEKRQLVRIVRASDGTLGIDPTGKANGRGAYICKETDCIEKAQKQKRLERAFSMSIPQELYQALNEIVKSE